MTQSRVEIDVLLEDDGTPSSMAEEIARGLRGDPKVIPSKYFYDERGSRLFERITELPEYYPTRTEQALLEQRAGEVASVTSPEELIELGSGSSKKTRLLIEAGLSHGRLRRYTTLEVSEKIARDSAERIASSYPELEVRALVGDFEHHLDQIPGTGRRLVAFLGGTIGNFMRTHAVGFLSEVTDLLTNGGRFLLGTDLVKDTRALEAAYNDAQGVTAAFNRNILNVVNHHLDGDFDPEGFEHVAFFDERAERIEMHLRSLRRQRVRLRAIPLEVELREGELMRTEISQKFTRSSAQRLLAEAGLELDRWFTDPRDRYALSLSAPA